LISTFFLYKKKEEKIIEVKRLNLIFGDFVRLNELRNSIHHFLENKDLYKAVLDLYGRSTENNRLPSLDDLTNLYLPHHLATGRLDSNFYKFFMDMLVKTYLTSYPELINEQNIKNTDMLSWMSFIQPYDSLPELKNKNPQKYEDVNKHFYTFVDLENRFIDYKPFILSQGFDLKYATIRIPKVFYCKKNVQHFNSTLDAFGPGLRNYFNLEPATMGNASPAVS
jgi:hypothetical protein